MIEIFKQFKKADDASTLVMRTSTKEMDKNEEVLLDDFENQEAGKNQKKGGQANTELDDDDIISD